MVSILDHASARMFTDSIRQLKRDIHNEWHDKAYDCWRVNRAAGWADGASVEADVIVESGFGKLYTNGAGGPQSNDMVVFLESPYRFRTDVRAGFRAGYLLVITEPGADGSPDTYRLFRIDSVKPTGVEDVLMDVFVSELFNTPMPGVI